ncbi:MAG TPA: VacB/RNase II family 3'-5' exoribonuclease [Elusimicrobiota bacterium]|nr:VacB/RNase II family 3'-5' exoribonuclease [Elusimicrobiota bacterium]
MQPSRRSDSLLEGQLQHHGRFAFLLSEAGRGEDLLIRGPSLRLAMDGDRVAARIVPGAGRPAGEIVRVLSRAKSTALGRLARRGAAWVLEPKIGDPFEILGFARGLKPKPGSLAVLRFTRWPEPRRAAAGMIEEVLGDAAAPAVRLVASLRERELPEAFAPEVLSEAKQFPDEVRPDMWRGRRELFQIPVFTIDGADAKDFDDAVSLEDLGGGRLRLGVHIADVSTYVRPGSSLDQEAVRRATSVYLPGRVVPMLPPKLSDDLCSLLPDVPRLTLSCFLDLDASGSIRDSRFEETVIRSWRRFTYEEVQAILEDRPVERVHPRVREAVRRMGALSLALRRTRMERGSLDFDFPEFKVIVDDRGEPLKVERRARLESHRLIEEFMLVANEACAVLLRSARAPLLNRIHERPDPLKLEALARDLAGIGFQAPPGLASDPGPALQELLRQAATHPLSETVQALSVRSLKQAVYSEKDESHFGLASAAYAHFTSPIRRYPDLFNHRAVRWILQGRRHETRPSAPQGLPALARHCSERERLAAEAERESVATLRARLYARRRGQILEGVASRQAPIGLFVYLPETGAVGLVRNGKAPLGAKLRVRLDAVKELDGELELSLVGGDRGGSRGAQPAGVPPSQQPPRKGRPAHPPGRPHERKESPSSAPQKQEPARPPKERHGAGRDHRRRGSRNRRRRR